MIESKQKITVEMMISAYSQGIFPMASEYENYKVDWYEPMLRCIIPIHNFHVPRSLKRTIRKNIFDVTINKSFDAVIRNCAAPRSASPGCWLSEELIEVYTELHHYNFAHSVEVWKNGTLAGGLFGVSIGGLFSGESMFHRVTDASKVALWATSEILRTGGFRLFDVQIWTDHLGRFGAETIPNNVYVKRLQEVLGDVPEFKLPENLVV